MYCVGWVGCPQCDLRSRVCIEVERPPAEDCRIYVYCPNDGSEHRFSLAHMQLVTECPAGLLAQPLSDFDQVGRPTMTRTLPAGLSRAWLGLALAGLGVAGAAAVFYAWLTLF